MKRFHSYLANLTCLTTSVITLTTTPVVALTINNRSPNPNPYQTAGYEVSGGIGVAVIHGIGILPLPAENSEFMNLLRGTFPDWTFVTAQQEIQGVFDIYTQKAIGITSSEAYQLAAPPGYRTGPYVGAELEFYYNPVGSDPSGSNVHWIQQVRSNHAVTKSYTGQVISEQHGQNQNKLDIVLEQTDPTFQDPLDPTKNTYNPYYDTFTIADSYYFYDAPGRPDITEEHSWKANLYLVEEIAPQTAKIYNGIFWGWSSDWSPTPTPPPPPPPSV